jgi:hypothetical protein
MIERILLKFFPHIYSSFHASIPQGRIIDFEGKLLNIEYGSKHEHLANELMAFDVHVLYPLKRVEEKIDRIIFEATQAFKVKSLISYIPGNTQRKIKFIFRANGSSISGSALLIPYLPSKKLYSFCKWFCRIYA